jgi:hypothetical protein
LGAPYAVEIATLFKEFVIEVERVRDEDGTLSEDRTESASASKIHNK